MSFLLRNAQDKPGSRKQSSFPQGLSGSLLFLGGHVSNPWLQGTCGGWRKWERVDQGIRASGGTQREAEKASWGRGRRAQLTMASRLSRSSGMVTLGQEAAASSPSSSISSPTADSKRGPQTTQRKAQEKRAHLCPLTVYPGPASPEINGSFQRPPNSSTCCATVPSSGSLLRAVSLTVPRESQEAQLGLQLLVLLIGGF